MDFAKFLAEVDALLKHQDPDDDAQREKSIQLAFEDAKFGMEVYSLEKGWRSWKVLSDS